MKENLLKKHTAVFVCILLIALWAPRSFVFASDYKIYNCQFSGASMTQEAEFNPETGMVSLKGFWSINKIDYIDGDNWFTTCVDGWYGPGPFGSYPWRDLVFFASTHEDGDYLAYAGYDGSYLFFSVQNNILIYPLLFSVFQPNEDGFSFENHCPVYFDEQLNMPVARTWDMFVQFFGENATMVGDNRGFTAERYFEEEYAKYYSKCGACDGFSGTSLINFENLEQLNSGIFNMPYYDNLYSQNINDDIREAIAYQQGFQFSQESISYFNNLERQSNKSPKFFYERIKQSIDNNEMLVVWIREIPKFWELLKKEGGHALVPYKYEEDNLNNKGYVYVYDSNYPGDNNRIIEFDLEKDEWAFEFEKDFLIWDGDIFDSYLTIATIPLDMRLDRGIAPWGVEVPPYYYIASVNETIDPFFDNGKGKKIGFLDGEFVDEFEDGLYFNILAQGQGEPPGFYYLPQKDVYDLNLYGREEDDIDFVVFGNQFSAKLKADIDLNATDNIKLDQNSLTYSTDDDYKNYSVSFTKEFDNLSRLIEINTSISKEDIDTIKLTEGGLEYINNGGAKTYDLLFKQRGVDRGEVSFSGIEISQNETQVIEILNQDDINSSEIIIEIDKDSDGITDEIKGIQLFFEDPKRETKLIVNTTSETFHFIAQDKDSGVLKADKMEIKNKAGVILIDYKSEDISFKATIKTGHKDFCSALMKDKKDKRHYLLIDKPGEEL